MRERVGGNTNGMKKHALARVLVERDEAEGYVVGFVDGGYNFKLKIEFILDYFFHIWIFFLFLPKTWVLTIYIFICILIYICICITLPS